MRVLGVAGSRKPGPGIASRSAAREMLRVVMAGAMAAGAQADWLDLRDLDLPFFDGRSLRDYGSPDLLRVDAAIRSAHLVVFSVPAYWGGPSGAVKNLLDLIGGPAYDLDPRERETCLTGRMVGLLVVGADEPSAYLGAAAVRNSLAALGAWVAPREVVVGNPRRHKNVNQLLEELHDFGGYLVRQVVNRVVTGQGSP